jgi:hypothetical protein
MVYDPIQTFYSVSAHIRDKYTHSYTATFTSYTADLLDFRNKLQSELCSRYDSFYFHGFLEYTKKGLPHYHGFLYLKQRLIKKNWSGNSSVSTDFYSITKNGWIKYYNRTKRTWIQDTTKKWCAYCVKNITLPPPILQGNYAVLEDIPQYYTIHKAPLTPEELLDKIWNEIDFTDIIYGNSQETHGKGVQKEIIQKEDLQEEVPKGKQEVI